MQNSPVLPYCTNKFLILFFEQDQYFSINDVANRVPYSEKKLTRVCLNLAKQSKLIRKRERINTCIPRYFCGHSTLWTCMSGVNIENGISSYCLRIYFIDRFLIRKSI